MGRWAGLLRLADIVHWQVQSESEIRGDQGTQGRPGEARGRQATHQPLPLLLETFLLPLRCEAPLSRLSVLHLPSTIRTRFLASFFHLSLKELIYLVLLPSTRLIGSPEVCLLPNGSNIFPTLFRTFFDDSVSRILPRVNSSIINQFDNLSKWFSRSSPCSPLRAQLSLSCLLSTSR